MGLGEQGRKFQDSVETSSSSGSPRICMPTWRSFTRRPFRCGFYEAQDILAEIDDVDLISLEMGWAAKFPENWLRIPLFHDVSGKLIFANPGLKKVRLERDYDVFIAVCDTYWDLPYINAIERWRDHCKVSICWINEMWAADVPNYKHWLHALSKFDYVFSGLKGTVSALSQVTGRTCHWLPGGVDALRFSPFPEPPARVIDFYSVGRRAERLHGEMLRTAEQRGLFYLHDTLINLANAEVHDHRQHRNLYANAAKRSRYFTVAAAKAGTEETAGQVEVGNRYYEGAAAGVVMIGDAPDCEAYRQLFDWPEAVVQVRPDGSDLRAVLRDLDSDPRRMAGISRRNTIEALRRHDWAYRWKEMFRVAGIKPSPRMVAREQRLKVVADIAAAPASTLP